MVKADWSETVTASELARHLGINPRTVRAFLRRHRYPRGHVPNAHYELTAQQADQVVRMWEAAH